MTIEEMKAKGFQRYTAYIKKLIVTKAVEVWAKDFDDACTIIENAAGKLPDNAFEDFDYPNVQEIYESGHPQCCFSAAQSTVTDYNEDFYKSEEK